MRTVFTREFSADTLHDEVLPAVKNGTVKSDDSAAATPAVADPANTQAEAEVDYEASEPTVESSVIEFNSSVEPNRVVPVAQPRVSNPAPAAALPQRRHRGSPTPKVEVESRRSWRRIRIPPKRLSMRSIQRFRHRN